MRYVQNKKLSHIALATFMAVSGLSSLVLIQHAHAAALDQVFVRFDHMATSAPTTGTVCITPHTTSTDVKSWSVTFPTGYTVSGTAANWETSNISTTDLAWPPGDGSAVAWPNATSATASVNTQTVTWTNSSAQTMNAGTLYCYNWTNTAALTIKSSATDSNIGTITTKNSSAATIDTGDYATASISAETVSVQASVPVAFSFALTNTTDNLGSLSISSVSSSSGVTPPTATVNTNAKNGWMVWAKDSSTGLHSASASYTIAANTYSGGGPTTVTAGTEGYNTGVTYGGQDDGTGTVTIDPGFAAGGAGQGGGLTTSFHGIATSDGSAANALIKLTNNVAINGATPAATDYTDTITVVGAGLF